MWAQADFNLSGAFLQDGTGGVSTAGDITTSDDAVTFTGAVTLTGNVKIDTDAAGTAGAVWFKSTVSGANALTVDAGTTGNVDFDAAVGATPLTALTIDGLNVDFASTVAVAGDIDIDAAGTVDFGGAVTTTGTGLVTISNTGVLTIVGAADFNLSGAFLQDGTGGVSTAGDITTSDDAVTFTGAVTLTGNVKIDTDAAGTAGAVWFKSTVSGANALTVDAGTTGNVDFDAAVGATPLTALTIDGLNVDFASTVAVAGNIDIDAAGTVDFGGAVTTTGTGLVTISNTGVLTIVGAADFNLSGAFLQDGTGGVSTAGDITTSDDAVTFTGAVTLTGNVKIDTDAAGTAGAVWFKSTVSGANALTVDAGTTGNVDFDAAVGATPLTALTIDGLNVDFDSTVAVAGDIDIDAAGTVDFGGAVTTTGTGLVTISNTGVLTIVGAADFNLSGAFLQDGTGGVSTAGDITTSDDAVTFTGAVTLTGNVDIDTTGTAAGNILFSSTIAMGGKNLALDAGSAGNVTLSGAVTGGGDLTVRDGAVQSYAALTVNKLEILAATTSVTFNGAVGSATTVSVTSGGTITVGNDAGDKMTAGASGSVTLVATGDITINAPIDPTSVTVQSGEDLQINASIMASSVIHLSAGVTAVQTAGALRRRACGSRAAGPSRWNRPETTWTYWPPTSAARSVTAMRTA